MNYMYFSAKSLQNALAAKFGVHPVEIDLNKKLAPPLHKGFDFNSKNLRSFIDTNLNQEIQRSYPHIRIRVSKAEADKLIEGSCIGLIAFIGSQLESMK